MRQVVLACALTLPFRCLARPQAQVTPRAEFSHSCSRSISRAVRKELERDIIKPARTAGADDWPKGCPFDPARDLWAAHERQKSRKRGHGSQWTCGLCGKVFKSEHYLDLHMERKHMNETPVSGVCLADYCEAFDACHAENKHRRRLEEKKPCNNETMARTRHDCESAMSRCFPLAKEASRRLNAQFSRQFCRVLDCRIRAERKRENSSEMMPLVIWLIFIALVCFMVFSAVVCCVDYSDDIFEALLDSGVASHATIKGLVSAREQVRHAGGFDRTKAI